jgi:hypothetical protein
MVKTLGEAMAEAYIEKEYGMIPFSKIEENIKEVYGFTDEEIAIIKDLATEMKKKEDLIDVPTLVMQIVANLCELETIKERKTL